ncbi:hypothetical protein BV25DRAFT_1922098 [Artomyces pyxidatus]|uniref:Uncharacterized protein n=1 Tax=Artomyces pyxidatus TaxID=48021 RepID=A0ACB8SEV7_9AGAM|nr:hypothetical protein BV25DRAFT_1922098 [Artomyces pyxidatus]
MALQTAQVDPLNPMYLPANNTSIPAVLEPESRGAHFVLDDHADDAGDGALRPIVPAPESYRSSSHPIATSPDRNPVTTRPALSSSVTSFYDPTKPLHPYCYNAKEGSRQDRKSLTNHVAERNTNAMANEQTLIILYWPADAAQPLTFRIGCPKWPYFSLKHCSVAIQKSLEFYMPLIDPA